MLLFDDGKSGAEIDGDYRYRLWRTFAPGPRIMYLGLNPSTADATTEDATSRLFLSCAKRWGFGSYETVNAWAYRATDPGALKLVKDPVGPRNPTTLAAASARATAVMVCCGAPKWRQGREHVWRVISDLARSHDLYALGDGTKAKVTAEGFPVHLLYQPSTLKPTLWRRRSL